MNMGENREHRLGRNRLIIFVGLVGTAFAVTLALVIGNRLSDEALAVLAGAVCGVGAAIPTSLIVVAVSRRHAESRMPPPGPGLHRGSYHGPHQGPYPPVVVVAPSGPQPQGINPWHSMPSFNTPTQRQFTVVGGPPAEPERAI